MSHPQEVVVAKRLAVLLQLEANAREAASPEALRFLMANETRKLISYRQGFVFSAWGSNAKPRLAMASSVATIERDAPLVRWLEKAVRAMGRQDNALSTRSISVADSPKALRENWSNYLLPHVLWCPLLAPSKHPIGLMLLTREEPFSPDEENLLTRLASTYGHAQNALLSRQRIAPRSEWRRRFASLVLLLLLVIAAFLPVRLSTLAPVEIVPKDPLVVSAPIDGVIAGLPVAPNSSVAVDDVIVRFEDTTIRNEHAVTEKTLSVAMAEYRRAVQGAIRDPESKASVALLRSQVALHQAELAYSGELLGQVVVAAKRDGLLIYSDRSDWIGRPVKVGERIMEIADPTKVELRIDLPVDDSISIREGAEVAIFLDMDPLNRIPALLTHASYHASVTPQNVLAYRVTADFDPSAKSDTEIRIGLQGTAKIFGDEVPLYFYLFRRPIASVRQFIGL